MRILMISLDKGLLGLRKEGDVLERHQKYAECVEELNIIVFNKSRTFYGLHFVPRGGACPQKVRDKRENLSSAKQIKNLKIYPTNSAAKLHYLWDAYKIGRKICQAEKIDLIDTQDPFFTGLIGYLLKKKFKIPLEVHFHGDFFNNKYWLKESFFNYLYLFLGKFLIKKADAIRSVSQGIKEKLIIMGISEAKIKVISTPVDLEKFAKVDIKKMEEIKNEYRGKKIILFIGALNKVKNAPLLINALKLVKEKFDDFVCLIIGEGKEFNNLKLQITNLKLEDCVRLLGSISHGELVNYYGAANFLVLPSLSESFGKVILEAASASKSTIATKTTGASELIINGETGFLVAIDNQKELAEKIYILLKDENLSVHLGIQAKIYIKKKFSQEQNIKKIIAFWQEIKG